MNMFRIFVLLLLSLLASFLVSMLMLLVYDQSNYIHYVQKEKILTSALSGKPVIALCGKVWTPGRDPEKFPVCPTCKEIYDGLKK